MKGRDKGLGHAEVGQGHAKDVPTVDFGSEGVVDLDLPEAGRAREATQEFAPAERGARGDANIMREAAPRFRLQAGRATGLVLPATNGKGGLPVVEVARDVREMVTVVGT